jgi:glycosyltransferase involved in cell wall biosynthesis
VQNPLSSEPWYWRLLNRANFFLCARVVFCSGGLQAEEGTFGPRFAAVPNGMGLRPGAAPAPLRRRPEEKVLCCVARLSRQKGQDIILRAFAALASDERPVRLVLAGDGEEKDALQRLALELGCAEQVDFLGRRSDIAAVLAGSDIYVSGARWEGLSVSLGEAMLAGLPCAATAIPGHADLLCDGETGLAVPPEKPAALAAALLRLLDEPALAARLGAASRERTARLFGVPAMGAAYARVYRDALRRRAHIFFFIHDLAPFGMQHSTLNIIKGLDPDKFRVTVCVLGSCSDMEAEYRSAGAEVHFLRACRYLCAPAWLKWLKHLLAARPDIVETTLPELGVPARLVAAFMPGTKVLHRVRNPLASESWYWRLLNRFTFPLCSSVVFCSEGIMREAGVLGARYRAIANGIAPAAPGDTPALRRRLGLPAGAKVICCVARLARQKGQDILLEAFALLAAGGRDLRLLLAGDGEDRPALEALADRLGILEKVFFLGRRNDTGALLAASDIYAAPSRWEGLSIAIGEAMLAGLPCAGTAIAGHEDLLRHGVTGLAVPAEDAAALSAALGRLLDEPEKAAALAAAGRELVLREYGTAPMAARCAAHYLELTGGAR